MAPRGRNPVGRSAARPDNGTRGAGGATSPSRRRRRRRGNIRGRHGWNESPARHAAPISLSASRTQRRICGTRGIPRSATTKTRRPVKLQPASSYAVRLDTSCGEKAPSAEEQLEMERELRNFERQWWEGGESALGVPEKRELNQFWYTKATARKLVDCCLENLRKFREDRFKHDRTGRRRARKIRDALETREDRVERLRREARIREMLRARREERKVGKRSRKLARDARNRDAWQQRENARLRLIEEQRVRYEHDLVAVRQADLAERRLYVERGWIPGGRDRPPTAWAPALLDDEALPNRGVEIAPEPLPASELESEEDYYECREETIPETSSSGGETSTDEENNQGYPGYDRVACVCCPSLVEAFLETTEVKTGQVRITLFDVDERFAEKYPGIFEKFNIFAPKINDSFREQFQFVIADTPYLTEECYGRISETIQFLSNPLPKFQFLLTTLQLSATVDLQLKPFVSMKVKRANTPNHSEFAKYLCYSNFINDDGIHKRSEE